MFPNTLQICLNLSPICPISLIFPNKPLYAQLRTQNALKPAIITNMPQNAQIMSLYNPIRPHKLPFCPNYLLHAPIRKYKSQYVSMHPLLALMLSIFPIISIIYDIQYYLSPSRDHMERNSLSFLLIAKLVIYINFFL